MSVVDKKFKFWHLLLSACLLLSSSTYAQEINSMIKGHNPDGSQTLFNGIPEEVASGLATKIAAADAGQMLDLRVILPSKDQAGLDKFVQTLYDPTSANYHQFLNSRQFAQRFGGSTVDAAMVTEQLKALGLTVQGQSANGFIFSVTGPVSTVESAFKVSISNYQRADGKRFFSPDNNPTLSPQLAGKISAIVGMDNAAIFHPHFHQRNPIKHRYMVSNTLSPRFSGPDGSLEPVDILTAYNLNGLPSTGSGQTQALFELDGYSTSDITAYETQFKLPNVTLNNILIDGVTGTAGANTGQVVSDIDLTLAMAPGLNAINVYEAPATDQGWIDQWNRIATDDSANVINVSWGEFESQFGLASNPSSTVSALHTLFAQLAAQGQSVFAAAGDSGAFDNCSKVSLQPNCTDNSGNPLTPVLSVDYPASDPNVTGVGISLLTVNGNGTYNSETASLQGGGGVSTQWPIPAYQATVASQAVGAAMVSTTMRNVPDVSLTSDPQTTYVINVNGTWVELWGSGMSSSIWAAFMARVNQGLIASGQPILGAFNPVIYPMAQTSKYSKDFHDITSGNNSNYPAETAYDDATGLGSLNGANLYSDLAGAVDPGAPTGVTATPGDIQATVSFSAPASNGGSPINLYTVTSTPGSFTATGSGSPIIVTGLSNGTSYTFTVTATNSVGTGPASAVSNSVTPDVVPDAPTSVSATATDAQAVVSFSAPASNGGTAVLSYTVTSSPGGLMATGSSSPLTVTGLTDGTPYTFTVVATNALGSGAASAPSNSVTPAGVPGAPTIVNAVAGDTQANVSFSGALSNGSAITSYTVTSSPGGFTASGSSSPLTVTGLTNGQAYTFTVTATNGLGTSAPSVASISVTPNIVPGAPTGVSATEGDSQSTVSFSAPTPNGGTAIISYTVTSSPGNLTAMGVSSPITITGLTNGTAYTFIVVATNATGPGPSSVVSNSVTPAGLPVAPSTVTATAGNGQATVGFSGAVNNGSTITSYTVTSNPGGLTASGASSPLTVTGLTNGTPYTFTVTATNSVGTSTASAASNSVTPAAVPSAPTTIAATAGDTQATINFSGALSNGSNITGYTVTSNPGGLTASGASSPLTVTGLTNGQPYTFTVTATNGIGTSTASSASNSVTPAGLPVAPSTVTATAGNGQATVSFSGAVNNGSTITNYTVTSNPGGLTASGAVSPLIVVGLTDGIPYTFTVTATNGIGTSSASAASNSVTPAAVPSAPTTLVATAGDTQATVTFSGALSNGSAITSYTVTSNPGGLTASGASSPLVVMGLTNGQSYVFTVSATNGIGTSAASSVSNSVTPAGLPVAPSSVTATAGNTQATVSFSGALNNGSPITSYTVTSNPGGLTASGAVSPLTVMGLTDGTAYTFTVTATNSIGTSSPSSVSNSVTPTAIVSPSGLNVTILASRIGGRVVYGGASLTWAQSSTPGVIYNMIYRASGTDPYSLVARVNASTAYTDTNAASGTTYSYKVTAYANGNESTFSNTVAVKF